MPDTSTLVGLLIQVAAQEAPAIIAAVQSKGGTVQQVGAILDQDAQVIQSDLQQLQGELTPKPPTP
jgi:hypothetical protein